MTKVLYQYNPENIRAFATLLCIEMENRAKQSYFANALWMILQSEYKGKSEFPKWNDLFKLKQDEEIPTKKEVIANILNDLR